MATKKTGSKTTKIAKQKSGKKLITITKTGKKRVARGCAVVKKPFWVNREMNQLLADFRSYHESGKSGNSSAVLMADALWQQQIQPHLDALIMYAISLIDRSKLADDELKAELAAELFEIVLTKLNIDDIESANSLAYLTSVARSKVLNYLAGNGRQKGCTMLNQIKRKTKRHVPKIPLADLQLGDGETVSRNSKLVDKIEITNFHHMYQQFDEEKTDIQEINPDLSFMERVDMKILSEFIADTDGVRRIHDIARDVLDILADVISSKITIGGDGRPVYWLFYDELPRRRPATNLTKMDIKLVLASINQAYGFYCEEFEAQPELVYGNAGLVYAGNDMG
jgi:hypothetical protein